MNFRLCEINRNYIFLIIFFSGELIRRYLFYNLNFQNAFFFNSCEKFKAMNGEETVLTSFWSMTSYRSPILRICLKIRISLVNFIIFFFNFTSPYDFIKKTLHMMLVLKGALLPKTWTKRAFL